MKGQNKLLPRYIQLANRLQAYIQGPGYAPGTKLPSQRELAEQFGTTLMTLRKALNILEEEGLIRTEHGVGTFVVDTLMEEDRFQLLSLSQEFKARSMSTAETRVLLANRAETHAAAARVFGFPAEVALGNLCRVRLLNGAPFLFQHSYLRPEHAPLVDQYQPGMSLYGLIQEGIGRDVVMAKELLQPISMSRQQASILESRPGTPAWLSLRIAADSDGQPLVYDEAVLHPDYFVLAIDHLGKKSSSQLNLLEERGFDPLSFLLEERP